MAHNETQVSLPLLIEWIQHRFEGVVIKNAYSELTFFYNPDHKLPNGVYFLTIKETDGPNFNAGADSSQLDTWLPHPIYAWMGWTMILSPSQVSLELLRPFIEESYLRAKKLFLKRVGNF